MGQFRLFGANPAGAAGNNPQRCENVRGCPSNEPTLLTALGVYKSAPAQLLPGTRDLLILKAVSLGPLHGYGVLLRIERTSGRALLVEHGALYPALFRLVRQGLLTASWGTSDNNRLGIAANAIGFSVLNPFILRPLDVPDSQTLYHFKLRDGTRSGSSRAACSRRSCIRPVHAIRSS